MSVQNSENGDYMKKILFFTLTALFSLPLWAQGGTTTPAPGAAPVGGSGSINSAPATGTDSVIEQQEEERNRRQGRQTRRLGRGTGTTPNGTGAQSGQGTGMGTGTGTGTTPSTTPSP